MGPRIEPPRGHPMFDEAPNAIGITDFDSLIPVCQKAVYKS